MNSILGIVVFCLMCIPAFMFEEDLNKDTDFPIHEVQKTIDVYHKQLSGINGITFKDCMLLAERVEC
jgi:hypothetical protein